MHLNDLLADCPGVDFTVPYKHVSSYSIGDYVIKQLPKTFAIIKSSPDTENEVIVDFVKADLADSFLPYSKASLLENLKCSNGTAEKFLLAQASFFAVTFEPKEYKKLGQFESVPFRVDPHTKLRTGGFGMVEKVFEDSTPLARKTIRDSYNTERYTMEIKILQLATGTGNPHLLRLRCAYTQGDHTCLVTSPWCELDLSTFLKNSSVLPLWINRDHMERVILVTNWMACLASGVSALHKKKIKHQELKPEIVLLDSEMSPIICDFGLSKAFDTDSKSVKAQGTPVYLPPEQETGKVGRKGDIFSLGLIFLELGLLLFGRNSLKQEIRSGPYHVVITKTLHVFLESKFPFQGRPQSDDWLTRFRKLLKDMLEVSPENRPKASEVWERLNGMVECLGATPHCEQVSPMESIPCEAEDDADDTEIQIRDPVFQMLTI